MGQHDAESFRIALLRPARVLCLCLELECRFPHGLVEKIEARLELGFGKMQLRIQQWAARIEVEKGNTVERPRRLPAAELVPAWDQAQLAAERVQHRRRRAVDERLAFNPLRPFGHDYQVTRRLVAEFEPLTPRELDRLRPDPIPFGELTTCDVGRSHLDDGGRAPATLVSNSTIVLPPGLADGSSLVR